ncbi:MAG: iron-containing alcohol dehydrogenase [bacterium]|nr:iron-containing alcohol dehydrogenase [bacterium]
MACCHYYAPETGGDTAFSVDTSSITFGRGVLAEAGDHARALGIQRIALLTDRGLSASEHVRKVRESLRVSGIDVVFYDEVQIEPTDVSFLAASDFARESEVDGFIAVGGGSVIDTTKAANLYSSHPADFLTYVNAPIGAGEAVPGPLRPFIACPTTSGTGSECTGIAIFDLLSMQSKTGIVSRALRPTRALIDPDTTRTLPDRVLAASALDVMSHALESYTALPYSQRAAPTRPSLRPMSQGANPWSDLGCREALNLAGRFLVRAVADVEDDEAREQMMWASTLAGIAFGNAGCHAPHGMSYSVSGLVREFCPDGYPPGVPIVPHGMSVIVNAPAVFRFTASAAPERHLTAAEYLGADVNGATAEDAGVVLADQIVKLMRATRIPNGLSGVGYDASDVSALTERAYPQRRLFSNAPREISRGQLADLYHAAISYW